ncbi:hypothetical protein C8Q77DRAFT_349414 [Trametes polyzona]|nr:hypothetical protein C8Q77DRAFT_349414 [Trametes polyzona]
MCLVIVSCGLVCLSVCLASCLASPRTVSYRTVRVSVRLGFSGRACNKPRVDRKLSNKHIRFWRLLTHSNIRLRGVCTTERGSSLALPSLVREDVAIERISRACVPFRTRDGRDSKPSMLAPGAVARESRIENRESRTFDGGGGGCDRSSIVSLSSPRGS